VEWGQLQRRLKRDKKTIKALAEALGVSDKTLRNYRAGAHATPRETAEELEAYAAGGRVLVHTADGWALFEPAAAPESVPPPRPPTARRTRTELDELRASAAALGVELPDVFDLTVEVAEDGSKLTQVMLPTGQTFTEHRRPDGTIASRRLVLPPAVDTQPVDKPSPSPGANFSGPEELTGKTARATLGAMLDLEVQRMGHDTTPFRRADIERVEAKLSPEEKDALRRAAARRGVGLSELIRAFARKVASEEG